MADRSHRIYILIQNSKWLPKQIFFLQNYSKREIFQCQVWIIMNYEYLISIVSSVVRLILHYWLIQIAICNISHYTESKLQQLPLNQPQQY